MVDANNYDEKNSAERHVCIHAHRKHHQDSADRANPRYDPTGNKLAAMKIQNEIHVALLTESKRAIENLMGQLGLEATGSGCAKVILLAAINSAGTLIAVT